ncbi:MAG: META domain-containing protein [Parasphingopyxis sp.]
MKILAKCLVAVASCMAFPIVPAMADRHDTAIEEASAPWADFRGMGTEPFWSLTISEDRMVFEHMDVFTAEADRPDQEVTAESTLYIAQSENPGNRDFIVLIEPRLCSDSMSDRPYPQSVRVIVDGLYFSGCGGDPQDVLSGADWHVTELLGEAVPVDAGINFQFDGEGGMFGTGGCNRFRADYRLDDSLSIGPVTSTRRACIDPEVSRRENQLFTALGSVISLSMEEFGALSLYLEDGSEIKAEFRGEGG